MFKKPMSQLKTSAPLRSSDRRKLRQRVLQTYPILSPEEGDALAPDGLQSQKFSTHLSYPGVVYLSPDGDPLWFTVGKGSEDLIPTVYTLWKRPDLLPFLSTPAPVVPKLIDGADLMIPGVIQHSPVLVPEQLVSITQYYREAMGPPLAVGRMATSSDTLRSLENEDAKGKAVYVLHTWKDALWEMGTSKKAEPPAPIEIKASEAETSGHVHHGTTTNNASNGEGEALPAAEEQKQLEPTAAASGAEAKTEEVKGLVPEGSTSNLTPEDVSHCLRASVLQVIATSLNGVPPSTFPIPASLFWSSYVLPARPVHALGTNGLADGSSLDVKNSTYKNVKPFLKACAKEGLLKLKETKGDIVVTAVYPQHPAVNSHRPHRTIGDLEAKARKAADRERKEKEEEEKRKTEIQVNELWMPFGTTISLFVAAEKDTSELYTLADIKTIVNAYISSRGLINANDQQYINLGSDDILAGAVYVKGEDTPEFMKRDEVLKQVRAHMQSWYEIKAEAHDTVRKQGELKPILVTVKTRPRNCTLVSGYEPFGIQGDELAEELKKMCASSTSVSPIRGKPNVLEVMVQGRQIKSVTDLLIARGVPKKWIENVDQTAGKKK